VTEKLTTAEALAEVQSYIEAGQEEDYERLQPALEVLDELVNGFEGFCLDHVPSQVFHDRLEYEQHMDEHYGLHLEDRDLDELQGISDDWALGTDELEAVNDELES